MGQSLAAALPMVAPMAQKFYGLGQTPGAAASSPAPAPGGKLFVDALPPERPPLPERNSYMNPDLGREQLAQMKGLLAQPPADAGHVETVQGVPMSGGIMQADPRNREGLAASPAPRAPRAPGGLFAQAPRAPGEQGGQRVAAPDPAPDAKVMPATEAKPGGLFDAVRGYLGTAQERLKGAPTNPLFQLGMGLAQAGYDGSNPYALINKNLTGIQALQIAANQDTRAQSESERKAAEQLQQQELAALLARVGQQYAPQQQATQAPTQRGARVIR